MRKLILGLSLGVMLIFGASDMLRGVAAPYLQHDLHINYLQLGYLFSSNSLGYLAGSLVAGFAIDRLGLRFVQALGIFVTVAGFTVVAFSGGIVTVFMGFILAGLGGGWLEIAVNGIVPAMETSDHGQARLFNWLHGFYGLGAFVFPVLAAWLIQHTNGWRSVYLMVAVVLLFGLAVVAVANYKGLRATTARKHDSIPLRKLFSHPVLYGLLIAIVAYVMAEVGLATWLPTYLVKVHDFSLARGSVYLSGFYLTFTFGRLTAHWWVHRIGSERAVLLSSFASVVFVVVMLAGGTKGLFAVFLAGAGFAIIFPTIAAVASRTFADHAGKVLGLLFSAAAIGSLTANFLIGLMATEYGLSVGMAVIVGFMALVFVSMVFVVWVQRRAFTLVE